MVEAVKGEHYINGPTVHRNVVDIDIIPKRDSLVDALLC